MLGNVTGWIISAVIAVVGVFLGYQLLLHLQPTAPTGWVGQAVQPLQLADMAKTILQPMTNLKDDAGTLYRDAVADYSAHQAQYEQLQKMKDFDVADVATVAGMNDLLKAAECPSMDLFKSKPDDLVGFADHIEELEKLHEIEKTAAYIVSLAKVEKHYDIARRYANAIAALGYHLYVERIAYVELTDGISYLGDGTAAMISIAQAEHDEEKVKALQQFDTVRRDEFTNKIEPVKQVLASQGQAGIGAHAGDMFQLAGLQTAETVWRVEAIRRVGRLHFNAENAADQAKSPKFLDSLASDPNPIIRLAALKSRNMTSYDNQSQR